MSLIALIPLYDSTLERTRPSRSTTHLIILMNIEIILSLMPRLFMFPGLNIINLLEVLFTLINFLL